MEGFDWESRSVPMSKPVAAYSSIAAYLIVIFLLKKRIQRPVEVPTVVAATHNLILCVGSLVMFVGTAYESLKVSEQKGSAMWMFCLPKGTPIKGSLFFWSYVYYMSKFYEFIDTVLLVLKGKKLTFLHVFHHAWVVVMAFWWLEAAQSLQQIALLTNTAIHVLMYYYFFMCSIKRPPRWKKLVTQAQIIQFVFSFTISIPFWIIHATQGGKCSGFHALVLNAAFNLCLLLLFINFHRSSYQQRHKGHREQELNKRS